MCTTKMCWILLLFTLINVTFARNAINHESEETYIDLAEFDVMSEPRELESDAEPNGLVPEMEFDSEPKKRISKAEKNCKKYTKYACDHPLKNNLNEESFSVRIIGGKQTRPGEFPHMAMILIEEGFWCGGSLISEYFVLSAAHCMVHSSEVIKKYYSVVLGGWHSNHKLDKTSKKFKIAEAYIHPQTTNRLYGDDIALLKLDRKVRFNSYIRPICLNTIMNTDFNRISASGWGLLQSGAPTSKILQKVDLYMSPEIQSKCEAAYDENFDKDVIFNATNNICAGYSKGGKDTCEGDSGGPLQVPSGSKCLNTYKQIGITSFGSSCGKREYPGAYAKVAFYISWIENIVW